MQLYLVLAQVEPAKLEMPPVCPSPRCGGTEFRLHQTVVKPLNDAMHQTVFVRRYRCCRCGHTFRVYPAGVTHAPTSRWVRQIAVLLYLLGLSYAAVSSALEVLGVYLCKSRVYDAVRAAELNRAVAGEAAVFCAVRRDHQGGVLLVQWMGNWLPLRLITDRRSELVLAVDTLSAAEIAQLRERLTPIVAAMAGYVVLEQHDAA